MGPDPSDLLAHTGEIRKLARHLIGDATLADDLTQDTLLAALQGRPPEGVPTHRWLAAVVRNLARQQRRSDARRREREARAAEPRPGSPGGSGQGALERLEAHRAVVDAVAALHEPYRSVVVARYFDGLAPRAIAAREGVPVRTVHTRLHRGLTLLRERLSRADESRPDGGLGAWLPLLLLPPASGSGGLLGTAAGAAMMNAKTKLVAGALVLAGLVTVGVSVLRGVEPDAVAAVDLPAPAELEAPEPAAPTPAPPPEPEARRAEVATEHAPAPAAPEEVLASVRGRVIDLDANPVPGVMVVHERHGGGRGEPVATAADGSFEFTLSSPDGTVRSVDERWMAVLEPVFWDSAPWGGPDDSERNVLVVAPALALAGEVVDEVGTPVPGARLEVHTPHHVRARLPLVLDGTTARSFFATADEAGRFVLDAAAIPGAMIRTWHAGFADDYRALPELDTFDLSIVLRGSEDRRTHLTGRVVDEQGLGVEDARVALGYQHTRTTPDGSFVLRVNESDPAGTLSALKAGQLPAMLERAGASNTGPDAWPDPLVLQLGGPPLTISGRVVDPEGEPMRGVHVELVDRTAFGPVEIPGQAGVTMAGYAEPLLRGELNSEPVVTGADGRFELRGLLPRDYTLSVFDRARMVYREHGGVAAGRSGVELVVPVEPVRDLAGRVVDRSGDPVPNLTITAIRRRPEGSPLAGTPWSQLWGASARTGEDGAFRFEGLSAEVTGLQISGPSVGLGKTFEIPPGADPEELEFEVPLRCHVQVDLAGSDLAADGFALLDPDGAPLSLGVFHGNFAYSSDRGRIEEGRSEVTSAGEDAAVLVFYLGELEVHRRPVELATGELNVLGP